MPDGSMLGRSVNWRRFLPTGSSGATLQGAQQRSGMLAW
jgi:hypothetical protein